MGYPVRITDNLKSQANLLRKDQVITLLFSYSNKVIFFTFKIDLGRPRGTAGGGLSATAKRR